MKKIRLTKTVDDELDDVKDEDDEDLPESQVGTFKAGEGKWGSCVRIAGPLRVLRSIKSIKL